MADIRPEVRSRDTEAVTLFKFAHVYDPTLKAPRSRSGKGVIANANKVASVFLDAIDGAEDEAARDEALGTVMDTFAPLKSPAEVSAIAPDLYRFAQWLPKFGPRTKAETLEQRTDGLSGLEQEDLDTLWDNLYFQAVTTRSVMVADAIVMLLRADAFLTAYAAQTAMTDPSDEELTEALNDLLLIAVANAEIPRALVARDLREPAPSKNDLTVRTKEHLMRVNKADRARHHIEVLNRAVEEVECAGRIYRKEYSEAYEKARAAVQQSPRYVSVGKPRPEGREPVTPPFNFTFRDPFDPDFLEEHLSEGTRSILDSVKCKTHNGLGDAADALRKERGKAYRKLFANGAQPRRKVLFGDVVIEEPVAVENNAFLIATEPVPGRTDRVSVFVTHYFADPESAAVSVEVDAVHPVHGHFPSGPQEPFYRSGNHVTFLLYPEGVPSDGEAYSLNGHYEVEHSAFSKDFEVPEFDAGTRFFGQFQFGQDEMAIDPGVAVYETAHGHDHVKLHGVKRLGVLEYKRVEQTLCCYVAGEVSHIENVMAREYREKVSRSLTRHETEQEDTTEKEVENLRDTVSTDRYEMQTEFSQMMQEEQSQQIGVNAGGSFSYDSGVGYAANVFANTNMNFASGSSSSATSGTAETFAQELTERVLQRIVERTSSRRVSRMLREHEETNTHGFDNRAGDRHVTGIYRWVDKIYENKLYNYGKRLLYEFMVPEPARNFRYWMTREDGPDTPATYIREPRPLSDFGMADGSWESVNEENYANAAAEYGADVNPPLRPSMVIGKSFADNPGNTGGQDRVTGGFSYELEIPDGYVSDGFQLYYSHVRHGKNNNDVRGYISVANRSFKTPVNIPFWSSDEYQWNSPPQGTGNEIAGILAFTVTTSDVGSFSLNVTAHCKRTEDTFRAWQQETYRAIMEAYHRRLDEWNNAKAASGMGQETDPHPDYRINPAEARAIEQRELRRLCIELMLEPFGRKSGQENYDRIDVCNTRYPIRRNSAFETHANYVRFMEEAFDWEIFSYQFYPYYAAGLARWGSLIKERSSADPLFQAFLQSGMAKVTLPIRLGYEHRVLYLLETGKIWGFSGATPDLDQKYPDLQAELALNNIDSETKEPIPEKCWKTRVPTALVILQSGSAPLDEDGLPCLCEDGTPIASGSSVLAGLEGQGGSGGASQASFRFPRHAGLSGSDAGKLVMNNGDGLAKVYQPDGPADEQLGHYILRLSDLGDLTDSSSITVTGTLGEVEFDRTEWRDGGTPADAIEELGFIKDFIDNDATLSTFLTATIDSGTLVIEETSMQSTSIALSGWPMYSLEVVAVSRPAIGAAPAGFPLGRLIAVEGDHAVISSAAVDTFALAVPFTVEHAIFNSGHALDLASDDDLAVVLRHLMVPAADGRVAPLALTAADMLNRDFFNTFRHQFVGVAIHATATEVTVMRLSHLSLLAHGLRWASGKGLLGHENVG
jgi:hypothetical protein